MLKKAVDKLNEVRISAYRYYMRDRKNYRILLAIYITAFLTIFRADYDYMDDLGRAYSGYHGWLDWSRWFTELISTFVHADWFLADISPIPQLIACFCITGASLIIIRIILPLLNVQDVCSGEKINTAYLKGKIDTEGKITIWIILASSLLGLSPYFLAMISYKYDSLYMAFSVMISLVPFLFMGRSSRFYCLVSFICSLLMCTTYQSSSGIYPMMVGVIALLSFNSGCSLKNQVVFIVKSSLSYCFALVFFRLVLMRPNGSEMASIRSLFPNILHKYITFYSYIRNDLKPLWLLLILCIAVIFFICFIKQSRRNYWTAVILAVVLLIWGSIACFGVNLVLTMEAYDCRAMVGFGVLVAVLAVYVAATKRMRISKGIIVVLAWCFFTFSLSYGNALAVQKEYRNYRAQLLAEDLTDLPQMSTGDLKTVHLKGSIELAPSIRNMSEGYNMLPRLIHPGLGEGTWGEFYLTHYLDIPNIQPTPDDYIEQNYPVLLDTMYHTIYGDDVNIVIKLK